MAQWLQYRGIHLLDDTLWAALLGEAVPQNVGRPPADFGQKFESACRRGGSRHEIRTQAIAAKEVLSHLHWHRGEALTVMADDGFYSEAQLAACA